MFPSTLYALSLVRLVLALLAAGITAQAPPPAATPNQELRCTAAAGSFASFSVTLDYSGWAPGSGYFTPTRASINDNYHSGQLTCVGSTLKGGIHCVGYDNGDRSAIFDVAVAASADNTMESLLHASYTFLRGFDHQPQTPGPWPCTSLPAGPSADVWYDDAVAVAPAPAPDALHCEKRNARLGLTMDYGSYVPGSGYFTPTGGTLVDNYRSAQLICIGASLTDDLSCLGYQNGLADTIMEATINAPGAGAAINVNAPVKGDGIRAQAGRPVANTASYSFVKSPDGNPDPQTAGPWPCTVSPQSGH